jgi:hypothetical protein
MQDTPYDEEYMKAEMNLYKKWNIVIHGFMSHRRMMPVFLLLTTIVHRPAREQHSSLFMFQYDIPGRYMFHAHAKFTDLGWMGFLVLEIVNLRAILTYNPVIYGIVTLLVLFCHKYNAMIY